MSEEHATAADADKATTRIHTIELDESAWKLLIKAGELGESPAQTLNRILDDRSNMRGEA